MIKYLSPIGKIPKYVSKCLSKKYFDKCLVNRSLWFNNPEEWDDPYEKYFLNNSYGDHDCCIKNRVYCSCFTSTRRTEAQWNAYSKGDIAIGIEIDFKDFLSSLESAVGNDGNIYVGRVSYVNNCRLSKRNVWQPLSISKEDARCIREEELCARLLLLKRKAFMYENEIRVIVVFNEQSTNNADLKGKYIVNTLTQQIILRVHISPHLDVDCSKYIRDLYKKKGLSAHRCSLYDAATSQVLEMP